MSRVGEQYRLPVSVNGEPQADAVYQAGQIDINE